MFICGRSNFYFLLGTKIQGINHGYNFKLLSAITPETKNRNVVFSLFYLFIGVDNNFLLTWREGILGNIGEYWGILARGRSITNVQKRTRANNPKFGSST